MGQPTDSASDPARAPTEGAGGSPADGARLCAGTPADRRPWA
eukprot:gene49248-64510_t